MSRELQHLLTYGVGLAVVVVLVLILILKVTASI